MDSYYNPKEYFETLRKRREFQQKLSEKFVQGIPY
jgi:hypothetical protein